MKAAKNRAERRKEAKVNSKKTPPKPTQSESLENIIWQPEEASLKEMLYELNQHFDNMKALCNNIILQQHQQLVELNNKNQEAKLKGKR